MKELEIRNDIIITLLKKQPFVDWLNSEFACKGSKQKRTLSHANQDPNLYIVPPSLYGMDYDLKIDKYIESKFNTIFENEISGWCSAGLSAPENITFAMFREWFEWVLHSRVYILE